jgi:hypothetical protein
MVTQGEGRRGVTQGDVRAQFQTFEGAGAVILLRGLFGGTGLPAIGAPPANLLEHSIRPFEQLWDGRHFCETDWHLLVIAIIAAPDEGEPQLPREEGEAILEAASVDLNLDGTRLTNTETTAITRLIRNVRIDEAGTIRELADGWWFQTGAFFGPGKLAVGPHTFSVTVTNPEGVFDVGPITFHIDAAGTGSCV